MLGATMRPLLLALLLPASLAAPPFIPDPTTTTTTTTTTTEAPTTTQAPETTQAATEAAQTTTVAATTFVPQTFTTQRPLDTTNIPVTPAPEEKEEQAAGITRIPGSERQALLLRLDLESAKLEELSVRQRAALEEELRYRELGLDPWADPNPWQRLTREQQLAFNEAYLALGDDVQEFARQMFVTVSEAQQEHAFNAFLSLDLATLTAVLQKEMAEQEALAEAEAEAARLAEAQKQSRERQRQLELERQQQLELSSRQRQRLRLRTEEPRNQQGRRISVNQVNPNARRRRPVQRPQQQQRFQNFQQQQQQTRPQQQTFQNFENFQPQQNFQQQQNFQPQQNFQQQQNFQNFQQQPAQQQFSTPQFAQLAEFVRQQDCGTRGARC